MTATRNEVLEQHPPVWHALDRAEIEARLRTGPNGLSAADASARLRRYGPNQLPEPPAPSRLALLAQQFRSPLIYILLIAVILTVGLGEYVDAAVIAVVLVLNAAIGFIQERQAELSVRALTRLLAPRARVRRDGRASEVSKRLCSGESHASPA